jgi:hypothetical protein
MGLTGAIRSHPLIFLFSLAAISLLGLLLAPPIPQQHPGVGYWYACAALYVLAKLLEHFDAAIFSVGHLMSGHALKHFVAAMACYAAVRALEARESVTGSGRRP